MMGACCCASLLVRCAVCLVVGLGGWRPVPAWRGAASFRDVSANESPNVVRTNEQRYPGAQRCTMKPSRCVCDACRWNKKADTSASASVLQYASTDDQARRRSEEPEAVDTPRDSFLCAATICYSAARQQAGCTGCTLSARASCAVGLVAAVCSRSSDARPS